MIGTKICVCSSSSSALGCSSAMLAKRAVGCPHRSRVSAGAAATGDIVPLRQLVIAINGTDARTLAADGGIGLELLKAGSGITGYVALYNLLNVDRGRDNVVVYYRPKSGSPTSEPHDVAVRRRWVEDQPTAAAIEQYLLEQFELEPGQACVRGVFYIGDEKIKGLQEINKDTPHVLQAVRSADHFEVYHPL